MQKKRSWKISYIFRKRNKIDYSPKNIIPIEFVNAFKPAKCPGLFRKPKVFFIQACRGSDIDHGVVRSNTRQVANEVTSWPLDADILIHFATPEGYFAWRDPMKGSWFIQGRATIFKYIYLIFGYYSRICLIIYFCWLVISLIRFLRLKIKPLAAA